MKRGRGRSHSLSRSRSRSSSRCSRGGSLRLLLVKSLSQEDLQLVFKTVRVFVCTAYSPLDSQLSASRYSNQVCETTKVSNREFHSFLGLSKLSDESGQ
jgi:hypothetical protein